MACSLWVCSAANALPSTWKNALKQSFPVSAPPAAGAVFVPLNPLLKAEQVGYILRDCNVRVLVTSSERLALLKETLPACHDLLHVVVLDSAELLPDSGAAHVCRWSDLLDSPAARGHRVIDTDVVGILYTSGSTGKPKGVVLSHRNMVAGAKSVASYLENRPDDTLLAALPLSFDAGFSQLTTAFHVGARVVLLNYLLPRDVIKTLEREKVTGLTAVPPLYIQLTQLTWPEAVATHLRYFATTGGRMPRETLGALREKLPKSKPFLMYGLTEAFRSTYLPPDEVDRRPDSIGKAIPNAEILVLREDGTACAPNEPGELVHRGALVGMGVLERSGEDRGALQAAPCGGGRPRIRFGAARDRGLFRRQRAHGRGRFHLFYRPARRDDKDVGISGSVRRRWRKFFMPPDWSASA